VYQATIGKVSPTDSVVLHHARIDEILKWTKEHLDAYLASADVIIDQRDEPNKRCRDSRSRHGPHHEWRNGPQPWAKSNS
jgi:hypothetical protein